MPHLHDAHKDKHVNSPLHVTHSHRCGCLSGDWSLKSFKADRSMQARSAKRGSVYTPLLYLSLTHTHPSLKKNLTHNIQHKTHLPNSCPQSTNCTEKQPQMVLHPSSLCHKRSYRKPRTSPCPPPETRAHSSGSVRFPKRFPQLLLRSRCVYRFQTASLKLRLHQHHKELD